MRSPRYLIEIAPFDEHISKTCSQHDYYCYIWIFPFRFRFQLVNKEWTCRRLIHSGRRRWQQKSVPMNFYSFLRCNLHLLVNENLNETFRLAVCQHQYYGCKQCIFIFTHHDVRE